MASRIFGWSSSGKAARTWLTTVKPGNGLDAVVAARTALLADADCAGGDVHVVVRDDEVFGLELVPVHQRADGTSALIHIGLRLDEHDLLGADARIRDLRVELVLPV